MKWHWTRVGTWNEEVPEKDRARIRAELRWEDKREQNEKPETDEHDFETGGFE
jgi:hypothetical protein